MGRKPLGGLWKTTTGGTSWTPLTDNLPVLGVSAIVVDSSDPNIMYIATGDGNRFDTYSVGVFKSTNGGASWTATGLSYSVEQRIAVKGLLIHPTNPLILIAATTKGIYRTSNGGISWALQQSGNFQEILFKPGDPNTVYASLHENQYPYGGNRNISGYSQIFRSLDGGNTWSQVTSFSEYNGHIALAVTPANPSFVGALCYKGYYTSENNGASFSLKYDTYTPWQSQVGGYKGSSGLCLTVSRTNANVIYAGSRDTWKTTDGGTNWALNTFWKDTSGIPTVHSGKNSMAFSPLSTRTLFQCNDGGLYKTSDEGAHWTDLSNGLQITQFYRFGNSATNANITIAGSQDNGTKIRDFLSYKDGLGGDRTRAYVDYTRHGTEAIIDYTNANIMYASGPYGEIYKSTDGGASWNDISTSLPRSLNFVAPYVMDPVNPNILYAGLAGEVWKTTDGGSSWAKISYGFNVLVANEIDVHTLAVAPSNAKTIYAAGNRYVLYKTTTGGGNGNWTPMKLPESISALTSIKVHPTNPNIVWISNSRYSAGNKVFRSDDGGASWTNISGSLPNVPANTIEYDKYTGVLYLGTDVGVFSRGPDTQDWQIFGEGLPNVIVSELEIQNSSHRLRAATFGRGLWEFDLGNIPPAVSIISPVNNAVYTAPATITIKANATDADGSVYSVKFYNSSTYLKTDFTSPYSYTISNLPAGIYVFTAKATDNEGAQTTSAPVTVVVNAPPPNVAPNFAVNGDASAEGNNCFILTHDQTPRSGTVWYKNYINLNENFDFNFKVFLGSKDKDGGNGIAFVLQPVSTSLSSAGIHLSNDSINPSVNVVYHTWQSIKVNDPSYDHIAVFKNGSNVAEAGPVQAHLTNANIEDGQWHTTRVTWDAAAKTMIVYFDSTRHLTYTNDIITNIFNGNSAVYWGFTGYCGEYSNLQKFCIDSTSFKEYKQVQTILFDSIPNKKCGDSSFVLKATASSGLPVTYAIISGPAIIRNDTLTITGAGVVRVRAQQAGNSVYNRVAADRIFTVLNGAPAGIPTITVNGGLLSASSPSPTDNASSFQWYKDSFAITNATSQTYKADESGKYTVSFTNPCRAGDRSAPVIIYVIAKKAPVVSLTTPTRNAIYAAPATITIKAAATDADGIISFVRFYNRSTLLSIDSTSPYTYTMTNVTAGNYSLLATATDNEGLTSLSASSAVTVLVTNKAPVVSITSPANNTVYTAPATFTVNAKATDADGTISKVEFVNENNGALLKTDSTSPYTYTASNVTAGNYSIIATAIDNKSLGSVSSSISVAVSVAANKAPVVKITSPVHNSIYTAPATITINATASDADGTISFVKFYNSSTLLKIDSVSPYTYTMTNAAPGYYNLLARATDNKGLNGLSASARVTVLKTNKAPVVSITSPANNTVYTAPVTFTINANATDADGTISKVDFYNAYNGTLLKTDSTSPYTYTASNITAGNYSYTAQAIDNKGLSSSSAGITVLVKANKAPTVNITSPANNSTYTAPATISIKAVAADGDGSISSVKFYNGTTYLKTVFTSPYTYTLSNLPAGKYSLTAKATDNKGAQTISAAVTVTVSNTTIVSRKPSFGSNNAGINDAVSLNLYPNPGSKTLNIVTKGLEENKQTTISVISASGVIMKRMQVNNPTQTIQLDVSSLVNGVYTIKVLNGHLVMYKQFVKL